MDESLQSVLDNCLILMHDFVALPKSKIDNDLLIKIFVRSALKVPSTSRVQQYFTDHVMKKSAIANCTAKTVREWILFRNTLRTRKGYETIEKLNRRDIKDIQYIKYLILAHEVKYKINGIVPIDFFKPKRFVVHSPAVELDITKYKDVREATLTTPQRILRDNLPSVCENQSQ